MLARSLLGAFHSSLFLRPAVMTMTVQLPNNPMLEPILPSPQLRPEDVVLDEQNDASGTALREVLEVIGSGHEILVELAETLGI